MDDHRSNLLPREKGIDFYHLRSQRPEPVERGPSLPQEGQEKTRRNNIFFLSTNFSIIRSKHKHSFRNQMHEMHPSHQYIAYLSLFIMTYHTPYNDHIKYSDTHS